MDKIEVVNKIKEIGVVAVIRGNNPEEAVAMSEACIKGGVMAIELAFTTPRAHEAIRELAKKYVDNPDVVIGAGTVLDRSRPVLPSSKEQNSSCRRPSTSKRSSCATATV